MKLHEIKTVREYYSITYLPNFPYTILIKLEIMSHFPNKHNLYFSK